MDPMEGAYGIELTLLEKATRAKQPISCTLELSPLCNMNCDMCYVRLTPAELEAQGRLRTPVEWLSLGREMQKAGVLLMLLTGGEPLLYPGFKEVYLGLRKMGMILRVNTNATMLDEEWADFFSANKPRQLSITLYGADDNAYRNLCHHPGGFQKVVNSIKMLRERDVPLRMTCSLTKTNREDIDRLATLAEKLGVPLRVDTYMMPATRERTIPFSHQSRLDPVEAARARIQSLKLEMGADLFRTFRDKILWETAHILPEEGPYKMTCRAAFCSFTVNWQGLMSPCVILDEPKVPVFELGFEEAWQQLQQKTDAIRTSPACGACSLRPVCRSCAAASLLETGSFDGTPDYLCRYAKESLRLLQEDAAHEN